MKKRNAKGAAMVMVLCVMLVFMALSLAILLAASTMVGTAQKAADAERCKTAAVSYSKMLEGLLAQNAKEKEMNDTQNFFKELISGGGVEAVYDDSLYQSPESWGKKTSILCGMDGKAIGSELHGYDIEMEVYWAGERENIRTLMEKYSTQEPKQPTDLAFNSLDLYISVICRKGKEMYKINTTYTIQVAPAEGEERTRWTFEPERIE